MATAAALFSLAGRSAFVTGAGQGLGAAIARGLAEAGARVVLADIDEAAVEAAAAGLRDAGHDAIAMPLDVRDEAAFRLCFDTAVQRFGGVDVMVNNAARTPSTSLWDIGAEEWDEVLAVNLRGSFFGCRIAGRHMRERGAGRIVNLGVDRRAAGQRGHRRSLCGLEGGHDRADPRLRAGARAARRHRECAGAGRGAQPGARCDGRGAAARAGAPASRSGASASRKRWPRRWSTWPRRPPPS